MFLKYSECYGKLESAMKPDNIIILVASTGTYKVPVKLSNSRSYLTCLPHNSYIGQGRQSAQTKALDTLYAIWQPRGRVLEGKFVFNVNRF